MVSDSIEQYAIVAMIVLITTLAILTTETIIRLRKRDKRWLELVRENSIKLKCLHEYNSRWEFYEIKKEIVIKKEFMSEKQFHEYNPDFLLNSALALQADDFLDRIQKADSNRAKYAQYCAGLSAPNHTDTPFPIIKMTRVPEKFFRAHERSLCEMGRLQPQMDFSVHVVLEFENHKREKTYSLDEVKQELQRLWIQRVRRTSEKIQELSRLNYAFNKKFYNAPANYHYTKLCTSLSDYRKYEFTNLFMTETIQNNYALFSERIQQMKQNEEYYHSYLRAYANLQATKGEIVRSSKVPPNIYFRTEKELCEDQKLKKPATAFSCSISVEYISPKGRSTNDYEQSYSFYEIICLQNRVRDEWKREWEYKKTKEYERSKMSDSIRYDILKRDGFRCVLCGATRADGAKLHVDHIKPISKGGKTEPSNLRTLCDRCNFGKRDKYDPFGVN